jgi:imidazolonepropionase-like amidohydrolase
MITAITNVRVFDGEHVLENETVVIDGPHIIAIGGTVPSGAAIVDGEGATLLPGLIDAHVHTGIDRLRDALRFGVTTELEMMGHWTPEQRKQVADSDDLADVRTAGFGLTAPGGHPSELHSKVRRGPPPPSHRAGDGHQHRFVAPTATTPEEAVEFITTRVNEGADYIKIMIEEGTVLKHPGLPMLSHETLIKAVDAAHRLGKLAIAHALTAAATETAISVGVDGLAHLFIDRPHTPELIDAIASSGAFVTPCLVLNSSIMGNSGAAFAADDRVRSKLSKEWMDTLCGSFNTYPEGNFKDVLDTVAALHKAGVDILAGTDVSVAVPQLGGLAHGASVHHEMQLLVSAGLSPLEALRSATAVPARRFGLEDRGRVKVGARADLLLVEGDPTTDITTTLSIRAVWRRGVRLANL